MSKYQVGFADKPCPFCGAPHGYLETSSIAFANYYERRDDEGNTYGHRVRCEACGCQTCWWHEPDDAIRAWNRREALRPYKQDSATQNDGKLVKVGERTIEVYPTDSIDAKTWDEAVEWCESLGKGWRLPTKDELNAMYENRKEIGGFASNYYYWSSSETDIGDAWVHYFGNGSQYYDSKFYDARVRAVRTVFDKIDYDANIVRVDIVGTSRVYSEQEYRKVVTQRDRLRRALESIADPEAHDYGLIPLRVLSIVATALQGEEK